MNTGELISPQPDQEGKKLGRPNSNFCRPLKNKSEGCPSNQDSAAAMTSASDEKWRPFNCFLQSGRAKDLSAPLNKATPLHWSIYLERAGIAQPVQRLATDWTDRESNPGEGGGGARFSVPVQIGPEVHPAFYKMGTGSFPGVKRRGRGVDHQPASSTEVKERVELYLCSTLGLRCLSQG